MTRKNFAASVLMLAVSLGTSVVAQPTTTPDAVSQRWLSIVDCADYAGSWDHAGGPFKSRITAKEWQTKETPVREPFGAVSERKLLDVKLSNTMPGLPGGKYAVVQFNSSFANKAAAIETLSLDREGDHWAVIGYFIK